MRDYSIKGNAENDMLGPWHKIAVSAFDFGGRYVLDVGAGTGRFLEHIRARGAEVHGIDPNPLNTQAMTAIGIPNTTGYLQPDFPLRPDVVTCFEVIEHVYDPHPVIAAARSVLKPGGTLIISTPNAFNIVRAVKFVAHQRHHDTLMDPVINASDAEHVRAYSFGMVHDLLAKYSFKNIRPLGPVPLRRYLARHIVMAADV